MNKKWTEAGGEFQFPFMGAASKILRGEYYIECPKCNHQFIRFYYHTFNSNDNTGTLWVWCNNCNTITHLPRNKPHIHVFPDPLKNMSSDEFVRFEKDSKLEFYDRLNEMWDEGKIGVPG